jgi:molybdate/tungstate transport system substrate-binding protein
MNKWVTSILVCAGLAVAVAGCGSASNENSQGKASNTGDAPSKNGMVQKLSVLYAGSMTNVMEQKIRPDVRKKYGIDMQGEGKGSSALAQMIRSGIARPDVFISASPAVNDNLLMGPKNHNLVKWYLEFARDQLVIAYSPKSRFKSQLEQAAAGRTPWYRVLETPGFRFGRTDPALDPKGAYTILMFELASRYYHQPDLRQTILKSDDNPHQVFPEESLLAQLTSGQMDAIIAYKHEAVEWGVPYITLPAAINLGDPKYAKTYAQATYRPKNGALQQGAPIVFTITIPRTAHDEAAAERFVEYMVSGAGHDLLLKDGFSPIQTQLVGSASAVPKTLRKLVPEASHR